MEKIEKRIEKLLSLATSPYKHEAEAAMSKAHELLTKYNIEIRKKNEKRNYVTIQIVPPKKRHCREIGLLSALIAEHYYVESVWYYTIKGKKTISRSLEISGTPKNVKIAEYVFEFVLRYIDREWENYKAISHARKKSSFAEGVIIGFGIRLNESRKVTGMELVTADNQLEDYLKEHYDKMGRPCHIKFKKPDAETLAGHKLGKNMVIYKGVTEGDNPGKKALL